MKWRREQAVLLAREVAVENLEWELKQHQLAEYVLTRRRALSRDEEADMQLTSRLRPSWPSLCSRDMLTLLHPDPDTMLSARRRWLLPSKPSAPRIRFSD